MTVYVIVQLKMTDRAAYDRYQARFFDVFSKFEGRLLSADEHPSVLEGGWIAIAGAMGIILLAKGFSPQASPLAMRSVRGKTDPRCASPFQSTVSDKITNGGDGANGANANGGASDDANDGASGDASANAPQLSAASHPLAPLPRRPD
jgi:hypothetical protein